MQNDFAKDSTKDGEEQKVTKMSHNANSVES